MNNDTRTAISALHAAWNRETGQSLRMGICSYELEHGYWQFLNAGHTEAEMATVIRYLRSQIAQDKRQPAALRWSNVMGNEMRFAEELELAIGETRRKPKPTALARALGQLRPTVAALTPQQAQVTAVPIGQLIENLKRAAGMAVKQ